MRPTSCLENVPSVTAFPLEGNIEFGEAVLAMLKRKAEQQLEIIAPAHDEHVVEFWKSLLDMLTILAKLGRERHRLTVLKTSDRGNREATWSNCCRFLWR